MFQRQTWIIRMPASRMDHVAPQSSGMCDQPLVLRVRWTLYLVTFRRGWQSPIPSFTANDETKKHPHVNHLIIPTHAPNLSSTLSSSFRLYRNLAVDTNLTALMLCLPFQQLPSQRKHVLFTDLLFIYLRNHSIHPASSLSDRHTAIEIQITSKQDDMKPWESWTTTRRAITWRRPMQTTGIYFLEHQILQIRL